MAIIGTTIRAEARTDFSVQKRQVCVAALYPRRFRRPLFPKLTLTFFRVRPEAKAPTELLPAEREPLAGKMSSDGLPEVDRWGQ